jgi:hypothetical protein
LRRARLTKEARYMAVTAQSQSEPWTLRASSTPEIGLTLRASFARWKRLIANVKAVATGSRKDGRKLRMDVKWRRRVCAFIQVVLIGNQAAIDGLEAMVSILMTSIDHPTIFPSLFRSKSAPHPRIPVSRSIQGNLDASYT